MSLVVSLRIPDGVVIGADSLSTVAGHMRLQAELRTQCPECKKDIQLRDLPPLPVPTPLSTSSFAQKLFSFHGKFGIGTFGQGVLVNRSVGYHIQTLEREHGAAEPVGVSAAAETLMRRFDELVHQEIPNIEELPDDFRPLGFQVAGYDDDEGKTVEVWIGKRSEMKLLPPGCSVSGAIEVPVKIWELNLPDFSSFSLQDAIDYVDFLIKTTADHQRFALMIPNVGGEVDIALVTSYQGFRWIRQKKLGRIVSGEEVRHA